jgi:signal transduction histidine kinase
VSGLDQLQYLSWLLYLVVFVAVLAQTIRRPTPAHVDITLFFGAVAIVIALTTVTARLHIAQPEWLANDLIGAIAMSLGYLLLRLVRDFSDVPSWLMRGVEAGLAVSVLAIVFGPSPLPPGVSLLLVAYLVVVIAYDTWAFTREALRTRGVTRRRMQAVAAGSLALTLALFVSGFSVAWPEWGAAWDQLGAALGLASGVCYFIGFAPPTWLRRAWQEPEIRAYLSRVATLTQLQDVRTIVHDLELGAADALGAAGATIGLWDPDTRRLAIFFQPPPTASTNDPPPSDEDGAVLQDGIWHVDPTQRPIAGGAFLEQRVSLVTDAALADPQNAALFEQYNARTILSAPITMHEKRLGVLLIYAARAPVFANSDLELVQILADQAAVVLENRALIDAAARLAAREEATRLKEDFLSSAAHDLKTPLTGLVTQAQILQRRADRDPKAPIDRVGLDRLLQQSLRLKDLVLELLDASRLEQGRLLGECENVDLGTFVDTAMRREPGWKRVELSIDNAPVTASVDKLRFDQVLTNLVENALKYSSHRSPVLARVWSEDGEARLSIRDSGIGIPSDDQPLVFERFFRARNVDDRHFAGMGLGLYIARSIVEQHGGRIWLTSTPGEGTTFFVALPAVPAEEAPESPDQVPVSVERLASA